MKSFTLVGALLAAASLGLAGCARDVTSPATAAPGRALQSASGGGVDQLVIFNGNRIPATFAASVASLGGTVTFQHAGAGFAIVSGLSDAAAAQVKGMKDVADVQADAPFQLDAPLAAMETDLNAAADVAQSVANPATAARYVWQWNMRLIHANTAWAAGKLGSASVTAAILDTGIDYNIPDMNGLVDLSRSASFVPTDDSLQVHFFAARNRVTDFNGHGTNVATQVSSKAFALAGVTSRTTLIAVKVLDRTGAGNVGRSLSGVLWAADHGANVANLSLGGGFAKAGEGRLVSIINRIFNYANRKGMLIVVAGGNDAADLDHDGNAFNSYCSAPHVLCVSAVGPATATGNGDTPAFYTNFGRSAISVAAPGGNADAAHGFAASAWPWGTDIASWVWSYCPKDRIAGLTTAGVPILTVCAAGNRLSGYIGTSQATPHVAGLAALLMAVYGTGDPAAIKDRIQATAVDGGLPGTDPYFGKGRIDAARALGL